MPFVEGGERGQVGEEVVEALRMSRMGWAGVKIAISGA
jgi:hypothetical protein